MKILRVTLTGLVLLTIACATQETDEASGDGTGETGDGDGDPTTGDGDGDGDPTGDGDGDGDLTTGDGDGDGDGNGDGDGDPDPECAEPLAPFMTYCNVPTPTCPSGFFCFLHQAEPNSNVDFIGYCSPECESDADCVWGSRGQCTNENIVCVTPDGATQARCVLGCEGDEDCYPGQFCHGAYDQCLPVVP